MKGGDLSNKPQPKVFLDARLVVDGKGNSRDGAAVFTRRLWDNFLLVLWYPKEMKEDKEAHKYITVASVVRCPVKELAKMMNARSVVLSGEPDVCLMIPRSHLVEQLNYTQLLHAGAFDL